MFWLGQMMGVIALIILNFMQYLELYKINPKILGDKYWEIIKYNIEPYYDFMCVLPDLTQKYDLYVITDELLEIQKEKLKQLGLLDSFKDIISSTHVGAVKPSSKLFKYALEIAHSTPNESLMIGDNPARDIKGGNSVGMNTVLIINLKKLL